MADLNLGPDGLLVDAEGSPISDTRDRLDLALKYIGNWYTATKGSDNQDVWWAQIDQVRAKVEAAEKAMDPAKIFPGKRELATYHDAQLAFADLWRQLNLSIDTIPKPDFLTKVSTDIFGEGGYLDSLVQLPGDLLNKAVGSALDGPAKWIVIAAVAALALVVGFKVWRMIA